MANSKASGGAILIGTQGVAANGTPEALVTAANDSFYTSVTIVAYSDNTGRVFIGGSDVDSSTHKGLAAGDSVTLAGKTRAIDLGDLYVDSAVNDEGVDFYAVL
jgi:hypothetical protein